MEDRLRAEASQEPLVRDAGEATPLFKRRRLRRLGLSVQVLGGGGGAESSQGSEAPQPLTTQDVEDHVSSPDLGRTGAALEAKPAGESGEEEVTENDERIDLWTETEAATSQELASAGRLTGIVKAEAAEQEEDMLAQTRAEEEQPVPVEEPFQRAASVASAVPSLQMDGLCGGFGGDGNGAGMQMAMMNTMGQMLQQMKEQNKEMATKKSNIVFVPTMFHNSSLPPAA